MLAFFARRASWWRWLALALGALALVTMLGAVFVAREMESSALQARYFSERAARLEFHLEPGASDAIRFPRNGPYDQRLGYTGLAGFLDRLGERGYRIESQARSSPELVDLIESGYFPPYPEKSQAGLRIQDCRNETLFSFRAPQ